MSHDATTRAIEYWCCGARRGGTRPLTEAERTWIRRLRSGHLRHVLAGLAIVPLALLVPLVILNGLRLPPGDVTTIVVGIWGFATFLLGLPVAILLVSDHWKAARELGADLRDGLAWTFEPPPAARPDDDDPMPAWAETFSLLPHARRRVDLAARTSDLAREEILEADPHTGTEFYAPLSLRVAEPAADVRFAQRPLSPVEREELDRVRRQLFLPRPGTAFAFLVLIALLGIGRFLAEGEGHGRVPGWSDLLTTVVAVGLCVRALMRYTRSILLAGRMSRDLATGLVVRVEESGSPLTEMLPFSRLFWRIAGAPAGWRDRRRAAATLRASL